MKTEKGWGVLVSFLHFIVNWTSTGTHTYGSYPKTISLWFWQKNTHYNSLSSLSLCLSLSLALSRSLYIYIYMPKLSFLSQPCSVKYIQFYLDIFSFYELYLCLLVFFIANCMFIFSPLFGCLYFSFSLRLFCLWFYL